MEPSDLFASVLTSAIAEVERQGVPVFTFALYHDHESGAVSVCVDTEESSNRSVAATNRFNMRYFAKAVAQGDLESADLWQANIGRSLSLGDFQLVNLARTKIEDIEVNHKFYVAMVQALFAVQGRLVPLSPNPERLVLACSGADSEVAYVWSLLGDA
jgi:hypothetical protein